MIILQSFCLLYQILTTLLVILKKTETLRNVNMQTAIKYFVEVLNFKTDV
jgi:hypothetical protein